MSINDRLKFDCLALAQAGEKSDTGRHSNPDAVVKRAQTYYDFAQAPKPQQPKQIRKPFSADEYMDNPDYVEEKIEVPE